MTTDGDLYSKCVLKEPIIISKALNLIKAVNSKIKTTMNNNKICNSITIKTSVTRDGGMLKIVRLQLQPSEVHNSQILSPQFLLSLCVYAQLNLQRGISVRCTFLFPKEKFLLSQLLLHVNSRIKVMIVWTVHLPRNRCYSATTDHRVQNSNERMK